MPKETLPPVAIVMGSKTDLPLMQAAIDVMKEFGLKPFVQVISAHRTPHEMLAFASSAFENGCKVIIAGAGGAAHLPGMIAAATTLPVIGVPLNRTDLHGIDALLSVVQMPVGVPVATVAVNGSKNAGILALQILAISSAPLQKKLTAFKERMKKEVKASKI